MEELKIIEYLLNQTKLEMEHCDLYCDTHPNERWRMHTPSKAKIKDNLKMIRRVALDLYKQYQ